MVVTLMTLSGERTEVRVLEKRIRRIMSEEQEND